MFASPAALIACNKRMLPSKIGRTFVGRGADTDIVVASAKALLNALNRLLAHSPQARDSEVWANP